MTQRYLPVYKDVVKIKVGRIKILYNLLCSIKFYFWWVYWAVLKFEVHVVHNVLSTL